jgi:hypothetical protein
MRSVIYVPMWSGFCNGLAFTSKIQLMRYYQKSTHLHCFSFKFERCIVLQHSQQILGR